MSAQLIPKKLKQQSILNMIKPSEKNVGPEPAGCTLSDKLKTEIKSFLAEELCAMKEEYELKLKEKESKIKKLKIKVEDQRIKVSDLTINFGNSVELGCSKCRELEIKYHFCRVSFNKSLMK